MTDFPDLNSVLNPPPPADPPYPPAEVQEEKKETKEDVHKQIEEVLKEYVTESNIPMNHAYWELVRKYRSM